MSRGAILRWLAAAAAVGGLLARHPGSAIDLAAYYQNARHYFGAGAAMYGSASGTGWAGGVYRYPPLFLYLFRSLAGLPFRAAVAVWGALQIVALGLVMHAIFRVWNARPGLWLVPAGVMLAPYAVISLRYGNAQWLIVCLAMAAFLAVSSIRAGGWLGLAAALKIWPLFLVPYAAALKRMRMAVAACIAAVALTLLPALWLGWSGLMQLARSWSVQEATISRLNQAAGEIFYPGQSLHDVLMRYCAHIDYALTPDARYRQIDWLHWAPASVERLWLVLAVAIGLAVLVEVWRSRDRVAAIGLVFATTLVIQPHVHRLLFVTLAWPALAVSRAWFEGRLSGWARRVFLLTAAAAAIEPLVPGGARQRVLQVYGYDFWLVLLPLVAVSAWLAWPCAAHAVVEHDEESAAVPAEVVAGADPRLVVVLPVYNEAGHVGAVLDGIFAQAPRVAPLELWVVAVEGGSSDATLDRLREAGHRHARLRVLIRPKRGLGDAYQHGMAFALDDLQAAYVMQMDGDGQHDAAKLPQLVAACRECVGASVGSRFAPGAATPGLSPRRRATSALANWAIQRCGGLPRLSDYTSGYRCWAAAALAAALPQARAAHGYAFQTRLIATALRNGVVVRELPIVFTTRRQGDSKLRPADYEEFLHILWGLRRQRTSGQAGIFSGVPPIASGSDHSHNPG